MFSTLLFGVLFVPPQHVAPPPDPISDAVEHFPADAVVSAWIDFGEKHLEWVENRMTGGLAHADEAAYSEYVMVLKRRLRCWRALRDIRSDYETEYGDRWRQENLDDLRAVLGEEMFFYGWIDPPVDVRFLAVY